MKAIRYGSKCPNAQKFEPCCNNPKAIPNENFKAILHYLAK